jgi:hypothetical protein
MIERSVKEFSDAGPILDEMRSPYHGVNLRKQPEVYLMRARRAGLFHAEPYKNDLLPLYAL